MKQTLDARRPHVKVEASPTRCPFCHASIEREAPDAVACRLCLARHHRACWTEGTACASCACRERLEVVADRPSRTHRWRRLLAPGLLTALSMAAVMAWPVSHTAYGRDVPSLAVILGLAPALTAFNAAWTRSYAWSLLTPIALALAHALGSPPSLGLVAVYVYVLLPFAAPPGVIATLVSRRLERPDPSLDDSAKRG